MAPSSPTSTKKRKRSKTKNDHDNDDEKEGPSKLPMKLLQSLETSDRKASKLRRSEMSAGTIPKSQAAQSQLNVQTHLMECRILLQKALTSLPALGVVDCENESGNGDVDDDRRVVKKAADRLLVRLLEARKTLYPHLIDDDDDSSDDSEEDETKQKYSQLIQEEEEQDDTNSESSSDSDEPQKETIESVLNKEYNALQPTWQSTLDRRHANLRLSSGGSQTSNSTKFKVIDRSFWSQVDDTVRHDAALQPPPIPPPPTDDGTLPPPLFDDSKVYRHMLQDFLTLSTERAGHSNGVGGVNAAAEAAAERLKRVMEKQRRRKQAGTMDGDVDRRASKGRKIRYVVYPKLTNFTFPVERKVVGDGTGIMDEDVLFKSMFGGVAGGVVDGT